MYNLNKEILNFHEECEFLCVSQSFLYKATHKKIIKYSKPNGKLCYFRRQDLIDWAMSNTQPTKEEIEENILNNLNNRK